MKRCKQPKRPSVRVPAQQQGTEILTTGPVYRVLSPGEMKDFIPLLKVDDVARLLGVSRKAVARMGHNGTLKAVRPLGFTRPIGYTAPSVLALLR